MKKNGIYAVVVKLVDTPVLEAGGAILESSSLSRGTIEEQKKESKSSLF